MKTRRTVGQPSIRIHGFPPRLRPEAAWPRRPARWWRPRRCRRSPILGSRAFLLRCAPRYRLRAPPGIQRRPAAAMVFLPVQQRRGRRPPMLSPAHAPSRESPICRFRTCHHGNGTQDIFSGARSSCCSASSAPSPLYPAAAAATRRAPAHRQRAAGRPASGLGRVFRDGLRAHRTAARRHSRRSWVDDLGRLRSHRLDPGLANLNADADD